MGDPSSFDIKFLEFKKKIKIIHIILIIITLLFIFSIITMMFMTQSLKSEMKNSEIDGNKLVNNTVGNLKLIDDSINLNKLDKNMAGNGILFDEKINLKVSNEFKFDEDDELSINKDFFSIASILKNGGKISKDLETNSLQVGSSDLNLTKGDIIASRIISKDIIKSKTILTDKIDAGNEKGKIITNSMKSNYVEVGSLENSGNLKVRGNVETDQLFSKDVKTERIEVGVFKAEGSGDISASGTIKTSKINVIDSKGAKTVQIDGKSGIINAKGISLNGDNVKKGDIITDGDIKTTNGNVEVNGNVISYGYIKANTLRLGLSSEIPTNSGEISANFISVGEGRDGGIKLKGHDSKISIEDKGIEKISLDGKTGTISLNDGKGQKTTLSVNNILEDVSVNDLTIEGKNPFIKIKDGSAGNEDYINLDSKGPKLEIVNHQGYRNINKIELNSLYPELKMLNGEKKVVVSARDSNVKISRKEGNLNFGVNESGGFINISKDGKEVFSLRNNSSIRLLSKEGKMAFLSPNKITIGENEKKLVLNGKSQEIIAKNKNSSFKLNPNGLKINESSKNNETKSLLEIVSSNKNQTQTFSISGKKLTIKHNNFVKYENDGEQIKFYSTGTRSRINSNGIHLGSVDKNSGTEITSNGTISLKTNNNEYFKVNPFYKNIEMKNDKNMLKLSAGNVEVKENNKNSLLNTDGLKISNNKTETVIDNNGNIFIKGEDKKSLIFNRKSNILSLSNGTGAILMDGDGKLSIKNDLGEKVFIANSNGSIELKNFQKPSRNLTISSNSMKFSNEGKEVNFDSNLPKMSLKSEKGDVEILSDKISLGAGENRIKIDGSNGDLTVAKNNFSSNILSGAVKVTGNENKSIYFGKDKEEDMVMNMSTKQNEFLKVSLRNRSVELKTEGKLKEKISIKTKSSAELEISSPEDSLKLKSDSLKLKKKGKFSAVLSVDSVQIYSDDVNDTVCFHEGQLVIGAGTCKGGKMLTAIWLGICQKKGFLRCPIEMSV